MSKTGWATRLGIVLGSLTVIHYLATGRLPFGTPQILRSEDGSEAAIDE
jgi:hypothetical protein